MPITLCLRPVTLVSLCVLASTARAGPQAWALQVGTTMLDRPADIVHDGAGGAYVVGTRFQASPSPQWQAFVRHVLPGGQIAWSHDLGAVGTDELGFGVALDGVGGLVIAGSTESDLGAGAPSGADAFVASYTGQGQLRWLRQYGSAGFEQARAICADGAGGYFVAGRSLGGFGGTPVNGLATWVMRLDGSGNPLWTLPIFDDVGFTEPNSLAQDGAGGLYVCGWTTGTLATPAGGQDGWLARIDANGSVQWLRQFGGVFTDTAAAVATAPDQGVFVAGRLAGPIPFGPPDGFLSRYTPTGDLVWTEVTGYADWDEFSDLVPNGSGGVYACGNAVAPVAQSVDAWYASYSGSGALEFIKYVGDPVQKDKELGAAIATDGGFGLFLAGWTDGSLYAASAGADDAILAYFDACELDPWAVYCTSTANSTGAVAEIAAFGSSRVTNDDFTLVTSSCPSGMLGMFVMGTTANSTPFGNGVLCVGGSVLRLLPALSTGSAGASALALDFDDSSSAAAQITPGSTWNFQFWFRDMAAGGAGFNLSNGLSATFCP